MTAKRFAELIIEHSTACYFCEYYLLIKVCNDDSLFKFYLEKSKAVGHPFVEIRQFSKRYEKDWLEQMAEFITAYNLVAKPSFTTHDVMVELELAMFSNK